MRWWEWLLLVGIWLALFVMESIDDERRRKRRFYQPWSE